MRDSDEATVQLNLKVGRRYRKWLGLKKELREHPSLDRTVEWVIDDYKMKSAALKAIRLKSIEMDELRAKLSPADAEQASTKSAQYIRDVIEGYRDYLVLVRHWPEEIAEAYTGPLQGFIGHLRKLSGVDPFMMGPVDDDAEFDLWPLLEKLETGRRGGPHHHHHRGDVRADDAESETVGQSPK